MPKPPHDQRGVPKQSQQQRPQQPQVTVQQVTTTGWSGPLPHPTQLERYNEIVPGGADRILKMAETEQLHRIGYESTGRDASIKEASRGQYLGAAISVVAIIGAVYTASIGAHWIVSASLVGIPVLGLVRAVVRPRTPKL